MKENHFHLDPFGTDCIKIVKYGDMVTFSRTSVFDLEIAGIPRDSQVSQVQEVTWPIVRVDRQLTPAELWAERSARQLAR